MRAYSETVSMIRAGKLFTGLAPGSKRLLMHARKQSASVSVAVIVILAGLTNFMLPADALARKVYSPAVEKGEAEIGYLLDYSVNTDPARNAGARHQFEYELGVTDRWLTAVYGDFRKNPGQKFTWQGVKWENVYVLTKPGEQWLDAGLYLEYFRPRAGLNLPDALEFKLLLEKESGGLTHTANLILTKELGRNALPHVIAGYAWRSKWRWRREIEPAIELYGGLGDVSQTLVPSRQSQQAGIVLLGKLHGGFSYEIGYLFGLTPVTDKGMLKFIIGYEL